MLSLLRTKIIWEPQGVYVQASGIATFEETYKILQNVIVDPRLKTARYRIYDFMQVKHFEHDSHAVISHASVTSACARSIKLPLQKLAFVIRPSEKNNHLFQIYRRSIKSPKIETRMFQSLMEAREWTNQNNTANVHAAANEVHQRVY